MNTRLFFWYLLLMAGSTYLIRAVPFSLMKQKIKNRFIRSFLYYIPYAVLTAMTVPAVFYATDSVPSAVAGMVVAVILALCNQGLTTVAIFSCVAVFLVELL